MWTRAEMKLRAKNTVRKYFWPALAVSMLNSLFNSNGGSSSGGFQAGANVSEELDLELESIINGGLGSVISELPQMASDTIHSIDATMATVFLIGALIGLAIALALGIFVAPIIEIGKNRFYMMSRQMGRAASMNCLIWGFRREYLNIIWTMLVRNILVALGTFFFVIPGIYLAYCYHMVPYILAENPDMRTSDVLRMSKDMMQGNKLAAWVLKLSFIGWWILGSLACGIGTYLVFPYYDATFAELYAALRNPYSKYLNGFGSDEYEEYREYQNQSVNWQQTYQQPVEEEQVIDAEPIVSVESPVAEKTEDTKHSESTSVRGYYLNGVFHPYTEEELKELEKNGY
ncbi:MAG: DUF975 family protein [Lachnospiraceae bacterium]|nr:DUF975 family protein [Lachnospiraceae bacterium]